MKKMFLAFALVCFVAFGTLGFQSAVAAVDNVEIVTMDLDGDPDQNKTAEANADGKDKKAKKESKDGKSECKDASAKCETKKACCSSKAKCDDKKSDPDKK